MLRYFVNRNKAYASCHSNFEYWSNNVVSCKVSMFFLETLIDNLYVNWGFYKWNLCDFFNTSTTERFWFECHGWNDLFLRNRWLIFTWNKITQHWICGNFQFKQIIHKTIAIWKFWCNSIRNLSIPNLRFSITKFVVFI